MTTEQRIEVSNAIFHKLMEIRGILKENNVCDEGLLVSIHDDVVSAYMLNEDNSAYILNINYWRDDEDGCFRPFNVNTRPFVDELNTEEHKEV